MIEEPGPLFSKGDMVLLRTSREMCRVEEDPILEAGEYWYQLRCSSAQKMVPEEDLEPAREVEMTAEYIKNRNLIWPCAISKENIFKNDYGISSVPTLVIIDREGRIQMIRSFVGELEQKRRVIERLL